MALFHLASTDGDYFALEGFFFGRIRDNDPALRGLLLIQPAHEDAVVQRSDLHNHFFDLSLTSIGWIAGISSARTRGLRLGLRAKTLLILFPRHLKIIRFLFLRIGFLSRPLLLLEFHSFRRSKFHFRIDLLGVNDESEIAE
jgi:hypothetical protein